MPDMQEVINCAKSLNKELLASSRYKQYISAKNTLLQFPEYKEMVDAFRKKQVKYEIDKVNGADSDLNKELALSNEYSDICLITACNDFFQAEMQLLELVRSVYSTVCGGLDIDMQFL